MNFWANRLNGQQVQAPLPTSRQLYPALVPYTPQSPSQETVSPAQSYTPTARMTQGSTCPGCGSDKYRAFGSYAIACGECGYHPRFEQSGYGDSNLRDPGMVATPARQTIGTQTMQGAIAALNAGHRDTSNTL